MQEYLDLFIKYWFLILPIISAIAYFLVSPKIRFRTMQTKNELEEMQIYVKKNGLIRAEIDSIHDEIKVHRDRIGLLETQLLQEKLANIKLRNEVKSLTEENTELRVENKELQRRLKTPKI